MWSVVNDGDFGGDQAPKGSVGIYSTWVTTSILKLSVVDIPLKRTHI